MTRRHSKKREQILNVLKKHHGALSAADIHKKLSELDLATIYRNLDIFVTDGEVKKLNIKDKEALFEYVQEEHYHAVCEDCDRVIHFTASGDKLKKLLKIPGFETDSIEITLRGNCCHTVRAEETE